ncbi:MAG: DNA mismatch repair endonuclease MutL [Tenericutes bacterium]|jgi:DNA mismatch repair protein MutL|nr:DNA mismatch repair endonuclease MutL [Mycoplasmatota bacterium]
MGIIKKLDPIIANKIAAGEVIEKLANVVKELVENAIDANAKHIDVELLDSGLKMIRVIDDGDGMEEDDILQAFERHATSKIISVNDLFRITSLGFRGEAIPSIASISKMSITSNQNTQAECVVFDNGKFVKKTDGHLNQGTKVEVEKIFYYTPARFKYLKSEHYELAMIQNLIHQFALSYPSISFKLTNNQKHLFVSSGDGNVLNLLAQMYGANVGRALFTFKGESRDYKIHGLTSKPVINRSNKNYIHIIVNHRVIQDTEIVRAILESYDQMIPKQRYPITALYIDVDPLLIDVNVHPRKQEIKFSEKKLLLELIKNTIEKEVKDKPIYQTVEKNEKQTSMSFHEEEKTYEDDEEIKNETNYKETKEDNKVEKTKKTIIPDLFYIGQYSGTYLIYQNDHGLFLVDQHAAAERIRYERYIQEMQVHNQAYKNTLVPLQMDYSSDVLQIVKNYQKDIEDIGINLEFHDNYILVKEVPYWFPEGYDDVYMEAIVDSFLEERPTSKKQLVDDLAILLACKHSLKANHYITEKEANHLIEDLRTCERPYTCPHGRPIIVKIEHQRIEHWFNRVI